MQINMQIHICFHLYIKQHIWVIFRYIDRIMYYGIYSYKFISVIGILCNRKRKIVLLLMEIFKIIRDNNNEVTYTY